MAYYKNEVVFSEMVRSIVIYFIYLFFTSVSLTLALLLYYALLWELIDKFVPSNNIENSSKTHTYRGEGETPKSEAEIFSLLLTISENVSDKSWIASRGAYFDVINSSVGGGQKSCEAQLCFLKWNRIYVLTHITDVASDSP